MQIRFSQFKKLVNEVLNEAEDVSPNCSVRFVVGQSIPLYRDVRVIPTGDGRYFAGEPTGQRNKGSSVAGGLPAGTPCTVIQKKGSSEAWVKVEGLDGPMRVHINKFCPTKSEEYSQSKMAVNPSVRRGPMTPAEKLTNAANEFKAAKAAYIRAKEAFETARREYDESLSGLDLDEI